jgi:osmotically-inducible protein OsmY
MRRELICALSMSGLLLACAHDKTRENAERDQQARQAATAQTEYDEQQQAERREEPAEHAVHHREPVAANAGGEQLPPDNTGVNARDREGGGPTPLDQGNSEIDVDLTQRIRKAVMADDKLSFTAKNVKIITRDGHVTLRGPVKSTGEREAIAKAAVAAAGPAHVTNQLEVEQ